jgi:hypothetical protein
MASVAYCTREMVQNALGQSDTVRNNVNIDRAILSAARDIENVWTHHRFYPTLTTRYPDPRRYVQGSVLWLDHIDYEMCSITSITTSGALLVAGTDFYLEPEDGPPFTSVRLYRGSSAAWPSEERSIAILGQQGASHATAPAGTLAAGINASVIEMLIPNSTLVGVGDLVTIGTERVIVTGKTLATTTATVSGTPAAQTGERSITVSDGTLIHEGELIAIDSERMFVESVAGNVLTVKRAENGSLLAAHANGATVYAPRACTIARGQTGTTAAAHSQGDALLVNDSPGLVREAALALAEVHLEQSKSGWNRTVATGDAEREATGGSLRQILEDLQAGYGRIRSGAV